MYLGQTPKMKVLSNGTCTIIWLTTESPNGNTPGVELIVERGRNFSPLYATNLQSSNHICSLTLDKAPKEASTSRNNHSQYVERKGVAFISDEQNNPPNFSLAVVRCLLQRIEAKSNKSGLLNWFRIDPFNKHKKKNI